MLFFTISQNVNEHTLQKSKCVQYENIKTVGFVIYRFVYMCVFLYVQK